MEDEFPDMDKSPGFGFKSPISYLKENAHVKLAKTFEGGPKAG